MSTYSWLAETYNANIYSNDRVGMELGVEVRSHDLPPTDHLTCCDLLRLFVVDDDDVTTPLKKKNSSCSFYLSVGRLLLSDCGFDLLGVFLLPGKRANSKITLVFLSLSPSLSLPSFLLPFFSLPVSPQTSVRPSHSVLFYLPTFLSSPPFHVHSSFPPCGLSTLPSVFLSFNPVVLSSFIPPSFPLS